MTGNVALDVFIGLLFVYALYSLFITTIVEIISTVFQLRARNLGRGIRRMLDDDNRVVLSNVFFKQARIKYMASGWLKLFNKPSYLQARNFSQAIIEMLDDQAENTSRKLELKNLRGALEVSSIKDTQTGKFLLSLYRNANDDLEKFKESLEQWFDDTMERVKGWYKKCMLLITFITGLVIVAAFNADTIQIVKKLSKDPKAREQFVEMATGLAANTALTDTLFDMGLRDKLLKGSVLKSKYGQDSLAFANFVTDSVYSNAVQVRKLLYARMDSLYIISEQSQSILNFERSKHKWYIFDSWLNFLGCLITAIALTLGAPFWFDLLNKFIQLRTSLIKPASGKKNETNK